MRDLRENLTLALQVFCGNFRSQLRESSQVMSKEFHHMGEQHQAHAQADDPQPVTPTDAQGQREAENTGEAEPIFE